MKDTAPLRTDKFLIITIIKCNMMCKLSFSAARNAGAKPSPEGKVARSAGRGIRENA